MKRMICAALALVVCLVLAACESNPGERPPESTQEEVSDLMSQKSEDSSDEKSPYLDGKKLVVFGDSITALGSWGRAAADNLNMAFFNGAMGGITSAQGIVRFPAYVASRDADFVTLLFGMNDLIMESAGNPRVTPEAFEQNMKTLVNMVRECGAEPILLTANPLDPGLFWSAQGQDRALYESVGGDPLAWLEVYNDVTRKVAKDSGTPLIDLFKACEGVDYKTLLRDGIHLADAGNRIFTDALTAWFESHYEHDPHAERVDNDGIYIPVTAESGRMSLYSVDPDDWYTVDPSVLSIRYYSNAMRLANMNGEWPCAECLPSSPLRVPIETGYLYFNLATYNVSASLILFFGGSTPSAYTEGTYLSINHALGAEQNEVGDIKPNQKLSGKIRLKDLGIPAQNIKDGYVLFTGLKLYVAGTAYQQVMLRELSVGVE